ncbi:MAG: asparagine synthase C-terminal domain-containing protein, partial [Planctomycetaceae bacterium]|nr:asparagine synthase C-terminal domain-containing protein [Planctomycetaceae bacterium]
ETPFARIAAESFGTQHKEFFVTPDIENILPKLVGHYDEPFADSSAVPTLYLCEKTRQEVTVALSGDGGDEMFAGYDRYRAVQLGQSVNRLPLFVRKTLANLRHFIPASAKQRNPFRRTKRFLEALSMEPLEQYLQWIAIFNRERRKKLYTAGFAEKLDGCDSLNFLKVLNDNVPDFVKRITLIDQQTYLPCDLMTKVDIASMAYGLEVRAPLLDYRIAEFAAKLPMFYKLSPAACGRFRGKLILREAFKDLLPPDIENRRKMGFGVPLDHWFRGPLKNYVKEILLDRQTVQRGMFRQEYVEQLLTEHFGNRFDHAYRIWALLILELWFRRWQEPALLAPGLNREGGN